MYFTGECATSVDVHIEWNKSVTIGGRRVKANKGSVIRPNYGEGEWGGGAIKWENRGSKPLCAPPPKNRVKPHLPPPPPLKGGYILH